MLNKLRKLFFEKSILPEQYVSHIQYREGIQALGFETYKDITISYIKKPSGFFEYNVFFERRFISGTANTLEELQDLVHFDIDNGFKDK